MKKIINELDINDISSSSTYPTGRKLKSRDYFMVHHTAGLGTAHGVVGVLNKRRLSVHWVVDTEGKVYKTLASNTFGAHVGGNAKNRKVSNANTEGVEVIGKDDNDIKQRAEKDIASGILPRQPEAVRQLVKYLGYSPSQIVGHGDVSTNKQATEGQYIKNYIIQNWDKPTDSSFKISDVKYDPNLNKEDIEKQEKLKKKLLDEKEFMNHMNEMINSEKKYSKSFFGSDYEEDVEFIQTALELLGYDLPNYGVDGKFGGETKRAVKKYKQDNELGDNGVVDVETLKSLVSNLNKKNISNEDLKKVRNESKNVNNNLLTEEEIKKIETLKDPQTIRIKDLINKLSK